MSEPIVKIEQASPVAIRPRELQAISETAAYVALLERAAMDPAFDLDRLERLIQLKDKALSDAARREFNQAMTAAQKDLPQVVRNAENTQTKSMYATLDAIGDAIDPVITSHGFSQSFSSEECPVAGHYRIVCRTAHDGGHEQIDKLDVPIDAAGIAGTKNKTATHALASTISYGRRILTMMVFNVKSRKALPDDDGNAAGGKIAKTITEEQIGEIISMIESVGAKKPIFLEVMKVSDIAEIPAARFGEAMNLLKQVQAQRNERSRA